MAQYNDFVQYLIDEGEQKGILEGKQDDKAEVNEYKGKLDAANMKLDDANMKLDAAISWFKEHHIPIPAEVMNPPKTN